MQPHTRRTPAHGKSKPTNQIQACITWLTGEEFLKFFLEGTGYFLFDTEQECKDHYKQIKGDDDEGWVYAVTVAPDGQWMNENT